MKKTVLLLCVGGMLLAGATGSALSQTVGSDSAVGCISRDASGSRFLDSSSRSRQDVISDILAAPQSGTSNLLDGCLAGVLRNMPAATYKKLSAKNPLAFQPMQPGNAVAVSSASASALPIVPALGSAPRFAYTNLDDFAPSGFLPIFGVAGITDDNRVGGFVFDQDFNTLVAMYEQGVVKVFAPGFPNRMNKLGVMGGYVLTDPVNGFTQAALFQEHSVRLIPRAPGEVTSQVFVLNDLGVAIVGSFDANFNGTPYIYAAGRLTRLNLNLQGQIVIADINNLGTVVGYRLLNGIFTAFKHSILTGKTTLLPPLPTEPHSFALDTNDLNDVLGYSFVSGALERIGIWGANGQFDTWFVEGTPQIPTVSNQLRFNDFRTIVVSVTNDRQSYLIPRKGLRLALADLIDYDRTTQGIPFYMLSISNTGSMTGVTDLVDFFITPKLGKR